MGLYGLLIKPKVMTTEEMTIKAKVDGKLSYRERAYGMLIGQSEEWKTELDFALAKSGIVRIEINNISV